MADPDRIVSQTSVKTGTEVGELCAVGICSLTTGVSSVSYTHLTLPTT